MEKVSKQEQIGYHKGALASIAKERLELLRLIKITEELIKMHIKALKSLGIDIEKQAKSLEKRAKTEKIEKLV